MLHETKCCGEGCVDTNKFLSLLWLKKKSICNTKVLLRLFSVCFFKLVFVNREKDLSYFTVM